MGEAMKLSVRTTVRGLHEPILGRIAIAGDRMCVVDGERTLAAFGDHIEPSSRTWARGT
jgi:hypothetical protein